MKKEKKIKVCSKCGSTDIDKVMTNMVGGINYFEDVCIQCMAKKGPDLIQGSRPKVIEILEKELESFRKSLKNK